MTLKGDGRITVRRTMASGWVDAWHAWKPGLLLMLAFNILTTGLYALGAHSPLLAMGWRVLGTSLLTAVIATLPILLLDCVFWFFLIRVLVLGTWPAFRLAPARLAIGIARFFIAAILLGVLLIVFFIAINIPVGLFANLVILVVREIAPAGPGASFSGWMAISLTLIHLAATAACAVPFFPVFFGIALGRAMPAAGIWQMMKKHIWRTLACLALPILLTFLWQQGVIGLALPDLVMSAGGTMAKAGLILILARLVLLPLEYLIYGWNVAVLANIYKDLWPASGGPAEAP